MDAMTAYVAAAVSPMTERQWGIIAIEFLLGRDRRHTRETFGGSRTLISKDCREAIEFIRIEIGLIKPTTRYLARKKERRDLERFLDAGI